MKETQREQSSKGVKRRKNYKKKKVHLIKMFTEVRKYPEPIWLNSAPT
jgi:hypothetical protein